MALENKGSFSSSPLIFLSPRTKDKAGNKVKPHFSVGRVKDNKIEQTNEEFTTVSGDLVRVDVKDREIKNNVMKEASLYLRDKTQNETYRIGLTFSIPARGLFNCLAGLETYEGLSIDIYENKKGYEAYGLQQNGQKTEWKYEVDELPRPDDIKDKKGTLVKRDYSDVDAFFEKELLAIAAKINKSSGAKPTEGAASAPASTPAATPAATTGPVDEPKEEDVPF